MGVRLVLVGVLLRTLDSCAATRDWAVRGLARGAHSSGGLSFGTTRGSAHALARGSAEGVGGCGKNCDRLKPSTSDRRSTRPGPNKGATSTRTKSECTQYGPCRD